MEVSLLVYLFNDASFTGVISFPCSMADLTLSITRTSIAFCTLSAVSMTLGTCAPYLSLHSCSANVWQQKDIIVLY